jgi:hypothetical protein
MSLNHRRVNHTHFTPQGKNSTNELKQIRQRQQKSVVSPDFVLLTSGIHRPKKKHKKLPHIPPFAQMQESSLPSRVLATCMGLMNSLNKQQMTGLCFLYLIAMAYAIDTKEKMQNKNSNKEKKYTAAEKKALKQQTLKTICTDKSLATYNKPNITLAINSEGKIIPKTCLTDETLTCMEQKVLWENFRNYNYAALNQRRAELNENHVKWTASIDRILDNIKIRSTIEQKKTFANIVQVIEIIKKAYDNSIDTQKYAGGNCGEHRSVTLMALLKKKLQYGLDLKIQTVW